MFEKRKENEIIPLCYDRAFKKIFGNNDAIERVEYFLSEYLDIPREALKGHVKVIESEKRINTKNSKRQRVDVISDIDLADDNKRINIELNIFDDNTKRNIVYVCNLVSGSIKNKEAYSKMPKIIQINFNNYEVDESNPRIVQRYFLKNEENHVLNEMIEIDQISLEKCYKAWYDKTVYKKEKKDQNIIKLGALLYMRDIKEIRSFIEKELKMEKELKEEIIDAVEEYNEDADEQLFYDKELDDWKVRQGALDDAKSEGAKEKSIAIAKNLLSMGLNIQDISKATGLTINENADEQLFYDKELDDWKVRQGALDDAKSERYALGAKENSIAIAKNLLKENIPIDIISKTTGLSTKELESIKNN